MEFIDKYAKIDGSDDDAMSAGGKWSKLFRCSVYWWRNKCSGLGSIRLSFNECYQRLTGGFAGPVHVCRSRWMHWFWKFCFLPRGRN